MRFFPIRFFQCLAVLVLVVFSGSSALAQTPSPAQGPDPAKVPALASVRQLTPDILWLGSWGGLDSWAATREGQTAVFYTTADGMGILTGPLFDGAGANITKQQVEAAQAGGYKLGMAFQEAPPPPPLPTAPGLSPSPVAPMVAARPHAPQPATGANMGETMYGELEKTHWFRLGQETGPVLYFAFDPRCPYCKEVFRKLKEGAAAEGRVQVRMVPVGLLSEESMINAASLLAAPDPAKTFEAFLSMGPNALQGLGNQESGQKLLENMQFVLRWGIDGVPWLSYRGKDGKIKILKGQPKDLDAVINDIAG
ncbi:MAG: thioredoxin fold domain-containing protein [Pseudomonadota bacterium]|nr:thioredoxin fold domain-containing protein [Pseudomonadota bacterium]